MDQFTDKEKKFFQQLRLASLKLKHFVAILLLILFAGLMFDGISGFPILRGSPNILSIIGGLFVLGILYICGEGAGSWLTSKDDVSQPLYRRFINLLILFGFVALFSYVAYKVLIFLNIKI